MTRSPDIRCVLLLIGVALLLWLPRLRGPIDLRYDAGIYYVTGTALARGEGYRLLHEPGEVQATQYPPLLPAFVAAHQKVLRTSDPTVVGPWLRLSFCAIFVLYVLAVYWMARIYLSVGGAFLVALVTALFPYNLFLSDLLFAELPFALATVLLVICSRKSERPVYFLLAALAGAAAYLLRTAGVALLFAWIAESLLQKRWRQAVLRTACSLLPVVGWQAYLNRVTSGEEYQQPAYAYQRADYYYYNVTYAENLKLIDPFTPELGRMALTDWIARGVENLAGTPVTLGDGVTGGARAWRLLPGIVESRTGFTLPPWLALIPLGVVGCLVLLGAVFLLIRREWLIPLYLVASVGLMYLTPWPGQFTRYLMPLTPFLALCLVASLTTLRAPAVQRWPVRGPVVWQVATALVLIGIFGTQLAVNLHAFVIRHQRGQTYPIAGEEGGRLFYYGPTWSNYDAALAWVREQSAPGDVLVTAAPAWAYLKTGRKAVLPPMVPVPAEAQRLLDSVPVTYAILDELEFQDAIQRYAEPTIQAHPERWELVYSPPGSKTRVYRRLE